jgi:hypothetical protein
MDRIQQLRGVAKPLGQWPTHLKVKATLRVLGDLPVDLLDLLIQLLSVNCGHLQSSASYQPRRPGDAVYCIATRAIARLAQHLAVGPTGLKRRQDGPPDAIRAFRRGAVPHAGWTR